MYVLLKFNRFSFSILRKDPKRNYSGCRVIIFYIKVGLNTIRNYHRYRTENVDILYITNRKQLLFYKDKVKIKYFRQCDIKKYRFLIKHNILRNVKYENSYIETPFHILGKEKRNFSVDKKIFLAEPTLLLLMDIRKFICSYYFEYVYTKFIKLKLNNRDIFILDIIEESVNGKACLTLVHGDLWDGNIICSHNDISLIDWDDLCIRSFTYDYFYYIFQLYNTNMKDFILHSDRIREEMLPIMIRISSKCNIPFKKDEYKKYFYLFLMERMIKRYEG